MMNIDEYALGLLEKLRILWSTARKKVSRLIFICHSLGGIMIRNVRITVNQRSEYKALLPIRTAIVFMGTPHRGSGLTDLLMPLALAIKLVLDHECDRNCLKIYNHRRKDLQRSVVLPSRIWNIFVWCCSTRESVWSHSAGW